MCMVVFEITKFSIKSKQYYFTIVYSALSIHWAASLPDWVTISVHHTLTLHCWTDDTVRQRGQVRSREWRTTTIRDVIKCMSVWLWSVQQYNYNELHKYGSGDLISDPDKCMCRIIVVLVSFTTVWPLVTLNKRVLFLQHTQWGKTAMATTTNIV